MSEKSKICVILTTLTDALSFEPGDITEIVKQGYQIVIPAKTYELIEAMANPPYSYILALEFLNEIDETKKEYPDSIKIISPNWDVEKLGKNSLEENKVNYMFKAIISHLREADIDLAIIIASDTSLSELVFKIKEKMLEIKNPEPAPKIIGAPYILV